MLLQLSSLQLAIAPLCIWLLYKFLSRTYATSKRLPLPPGPPGEPILGHLRIVPTSHAELAYMAWGKQYRSDVLYFEILGRPIVVLNSAQAATDLLDKRGANYSDRPRFVLFEVMGWEATLTFLRWGPRFRMHRKLLQNTFAKTNCAKYRKLEEREAHQLLNGVLEKPNEWERLLRRFATAVILGIGYGVTIKDDSDPYIQIAVDGSYGISHGGAPAGTAVDFFPFLRYFPNWLARSWSLKFARDWRRATRQLHDVPFAAAQQRWKDGSCEDSLISSLLEKEKHGENNEMTLDDIKGVAGAVYAAGQDTTNTTLVVFVLGMVLYPDVQQKAQAEIDVAVGRERLPDFGDREKLPYIHNIVQETFRWAPATPLGVPHRSLADDTYRGMFIPAGSHIYANAQAMTHDEATHKNPHEFNPDRYSYPLNEPYPVGHFGFGRRVCPGQYLAEESVWIVIATMLAKFNIEKAVGDDGKEITPKVSFTSGLGSHPENFPCVIKKRSR